jgi:hypothetical protein
MQQNTTTERTDDKTDAPFRAGDVGSTRGHGTLRVRAVLNHVNGTDYPLTDCDVDTMRAMGEIVVAMRNFHQHRSRCRKGKYGKVQCAVTLPKPFGEFDPEFRSIDSTRFYAAKYLSKNHAELNLSLGLLHVSRNLALKYDSVADEAGTAVCDAKLHLAKLVNKTTALQEYSIDQASATLLGVDYRSRLY